MLVAALAMVLVFSAVPGAAFASTSVSVSVASIGRNALGYLTYDVSATVAGYKMPGGVCGASGWGIYCDLSVEVKYASDGSTHSLATADARTFGDPFTKQFTGTATMPQVAAIRARIGGGGNTDYTSVVGDWVVVNDPYPAQSVSVSVASIGRNALGYLTYDVSATVAGYKMPGGVCGASGWGIYCDLSVEVKYASDGSTHSLATADARTFGDPFTKQFTGTATMPQVAAIRARIGGGGNTDYTEALQV